MQKFTDVLEQPREVLVLPFLRHQAATGRGSDEPPFDDLYLTLFSPDSLHIIKHDLQTGVSTVGKRTGSNGHVIVVQAARMQECWPRLPCLKYLTSSWLQVAVNLCPTWICQRLK